MIGQDTVFILGAGASCPYGFPDGAQLAQKICSNLIGDIEQLYQQNDFVEMDYKKAIEHSQVFINKFSKADMSIDLFLSLNNEFMDMGKPAIIFRILEAEKNSKFRQDMVQKEHDWYEIIKQKLIEGITQKEDYSRISENKVTFITFNYDRSFECFLQESFLNSFHKIPEEKINEQLRKINIIHLFGQIGGLKWQNMDLTNEYRSNPYTVNLKELSKKIDIIYEKEDSPLLQKARDIISKAQKIFFLGFGFLNENLKLLKIPEILNNNQFIYGTGYNLYPEEIEKYENILNPLHMSYRFNMQNCDCRALLRKYL
jgi:hypothetical protein